MQLLEAPRRGCLAEARRLACSGHWLTVALDMPGGQIGKNSQEGNVTIVE